MEVTQYLTDAFKTQTMFEVPLEDIVSGETYKGLYYKRGDVYEFRDCATDKFLPTCKMRLTTLANWKQPLQKSPKGSIYLEITGEMVATKGAPAKSYPESIVINDIVLMQASETGMCDNPKLGGGK